VGPLGTISSEDDPRLICPSSSSSHWGNIHICCDTICSVRQSGVIFECSEISKRWS